MSKLKALSLSCLLALAALTVPAFAHYANRDWVWAAADRLGDGVWGI